MYHNLVSALALACMCGLVQAEIVNLFGLCENQLTPEWRVKSTEDLTLTIDNNWAVGELSCKVRLTGVDKDYTLYYQFNHFQVTDSSSYLTLTLKSNSGHTTMKTYSKLIYPDFKQRKGYNEIIIELHSGSLSESFPRLFATLTISSRDNTALFSFPTWNIIGIVVGIVVFIIVVILIIYRTKLRRQARAAGVRCGPPVYPVVAYNNTNTRGAPAGVYPVTPYTPKPYEPQPMASAYPPPYSGQPQGAPPGYSPPPSDPPPPYQISDHSSKNNAPS